MIAMEKREKYKIQSFFYRWPISVQDRLYVSPWYGPLAGLRVRILALHFCTGSTYAAKHKEVRKRSNRSYGYAFTPGILPSAPSGPASLRSAVQNRSLRFYRSRAASTNTNPARRTGRTNAAKPMDGRERPAPAMPKGHTFKTILCRPGEKNGLACFHAD
jgi:hypothetical protein